MPLFSKVKDIFKGGGSNKKKKVYHNVKLDNPEEIWEIHCELGDGAYGKVYKCQNKVNGTLAALKQVALEAEEDLETFMIEIDILTEFKNEDIVELLEAYHYDGKLWMYLEYCDGGALDSIMVDLDRPLNEKQIAYVTKHLCNALIYIHENKVIHRDLKAGNVLLTMKGGIKLADFGVSAKNKNTYDKRGTFIGTPYWLAPEVILCETFIDAKYDYKADIWSLGISLIEFAQMDPPNHDVSPLRVMLKIQKSDPPRLDYPSRFSKEFNDFIAKCLVKDPIQRPSATELLKHPFINRELSDKPIKDLLLEYKADVVEFEEDVDDDDRTSRLSIDSDVSARQDDSTLKPDTPSQEKEAERPKTIIENNVTKDDKEVPSGERKMSKGPAPPPPTVNNSSAPAATIASSLSSVAATTPGAITSPSKGKARPAPAAPTATTNSTNATTTAAVAASPTKPQAPAPPPTAVPVASPISPVDKPVTSPVDKPVITPSPPASPPASQALTISSATSQSPTPATSNVPPPTTGKTTSDSLSNVDTHKQQPEVAIVTPEKVLKPDIPEPSTKTQPETNDDHFDQSKSSDVSSIIVQPVLDIKDVIRDAKRLSTEVMDTSENEPKKESEIIGEIPNAIPMEQDTEDIPVETTKMEVDKTEDNVSNNERLIKDDPTKIEVEVNDIDVVNNEKLSKVQPDQLKTIAKKASDAALSVPSISSSPPSITVDTEVSVVEPKVLHINDISNADLPASEVELLASDSPADSATIIASIGSEGTVIVRTPTPTPIDNAQPSQQTPKKQSVVTYSGPAIVDGEEGRSNEATEAAADNCSEAAAAITSDISQAPEKELPSPLPHVTDSSSPSSPSLSEAEEQAVRMLDSAIDSAVSVGVEDSSVDERDEADNTSLLITRDDKLMNDVDASIHGEEIKDLDSVTEVTVSGSPEKVVHKLDESEVVISNSSILHDNEESENEPQIKARYELTLDDLGASTEQPTKVDTSMDQANISVVAVDIPSQEKQQTSIAHSELDIQGGNNLETSSNISNISNLSGGTHESTGGRSVSSGEEDVRPVSVTIAGTTLSHTDVDDDVFDQTENPQTKNDKEISHELVEQTGENVLPNQKPALVRDITIESNISGEVSVSSPTSSISPLTPSTTPLSPFTPSTTPLTPLAPTIVTTPNNLPNGIGKESHKISDVTKNDQNDIGDFEVVTLRNPDAVRKPTSHHLEQKIQRKIEDKENQTKEEQESIALRKKMRKRTRKFVIDGVVVTTTTSKVIYGDDEEITTMNASHLARKQELRELKVLQRQEQKQFQELGVKANFAKLEQEKKFEVEKQQLLRGYDTEVEGLNRQQKQQVEKAEASQELELKMSSKRIRTEQEKELKSFREALKTELKLLKQEIDLLPKEKRKEALKIRKERLENDQSEREKAFLEKLHEAHELSLKRLGDDHRERIALLERQFLQQKHQLLRSRESALWEMEERHLHEKHQCAKRQLKDIFFLQRHQMLLRHEKELEQVKRMNVQKEDELVKRQQVERRALPKRIRQEMKAREMMFRESLRISTSHLPDHHEDEKDRLKKFQDGEKKRYEAEKKRAEQKHKRQLEELQAASEATSKELEQLQNEKRKMLMEHETYKLRCQDEEYQKELREWKANLKPRKQKLEEEFEKQLVEQEQFYGAYLSRGLGSSMAPSQSTASLRSSTASYRDS